MKSTSYGIFGSIIFHVIVLMILIFTFTKSSHVQHTVPPKVDKDNVVEIMSLGGQGDVRDIAFDSAGNPCDPSLSTYLGVGFIYSKISGEVLAAPINLPAYKAGIRVGDLFLNDPDVDHDGFLTLSILRRGHTTPITFTIKAIKICFKEGN